MSKKKKKKRGIHHSLVVCRSLFFPQRIIFLKCSLMAVSKSVIVVEMSTGAAGGQESDWVINQADPSKA